MCALFQISTKYPYFLKSLPTCSAAGCMSACLSAPTSACLSNCLSTCLSNCLSNCLSVCLSNCLSTCLAVWMSACLSDHWHSGLAIGVLGLGLKVKWTDLCKKNHWPDATFDWDPFRNNSVPLSPLCTRPLSRSLTFCDYLNKVKIEISWFSRYFFKVLLETA